MDKKKVSYRKKILCVSVMRSKGGGEEFLLKLCENVNEYDYVIASPEGEAITYFRKNGIKTITINSLSKIYRGPGWNLYSFFKIIFNIKISTFRLLRLFRTEKPDLILSNGLFAALYNLFAVFLTRKKFIIVQHLIFNEKSIENKVLRLIHHCTEKIICVSEAVRENVLLLLKKSDSEKIVVIPNGITIPGKRAPGQITSDKIRIGMVGIIIRIKGIYLVIEALKDILIENNAAFYIYGSTSDNEDSLKYKAELVELIKIHGISDKVLFMGHIDSRDDIYASLDIVINFSVIPEALPYSVLETMAYEKIVIAADSGGSKEIINDSENGFLVEPGRVDLLKEKIEFCIRNIRSESFNQIRERAYERVKNQYSVEKFAENYNNMFNSLFKS